VRNFVENKNLKIFWELPDDAANHNISNVNYTYSNIVNNVMHSSTLDHFIGSEMLYNNTIEANVINSSDNLSGHLPIYMKMNISNLNLEVEQQVRSPKPSWERATTEQRAEYQSVLNDNLQGIIPPQLCESCNTLKCELHSLDIDVYTTQICEALNNAARDCLPLSGARERTEGRKVLPGWNEYVKPFQDENKFWYSLWLSAGSPLQGELYNLQRTTRMQYKYAVRRLKRTSNNIQHQKFIEGLIHGGKDIFSEIRKFRGNSKSISSSIDGVVGSDNISRHFAGIYQDLYSNHQLGPELNEVNQVIEEKIDQSLLPNLDNVNTSTVRAALQKLKGGKSDAIFDFNSDCLINSSDELISAVTHLFKWFLRTGTVPNFLLLCTLVPIVKDNLSDISSSDNYRAIAIGSLILKWFDWLILIIESDKLTTDELQFGFQAKASTSMCTWAVSAVVDHYNRSGRPVYSCAMDLSKAFDLVAWDNLFYELMDRGISPLILRCLMFIYVNQSCSVRWGSKYSNTFSVNNGVRQGAVSSPILFCVYMNNLINLLRSTSIGCQINGIYLGIWVYADDIILLSPSRSGLQQMVNICEKFSVDYKLKFSTNIDIRKSKTKCIIFSKTVINDENVSPIILNGMPLPYVNEVKHLGNILQSDNSMSKDSSMKRACFISKVHSLNQELYFADPFFVMKMYNIYSCSFHGSNLWDLFGRDVNRLYSSWNMAVKVLFDLPRETHRYFIEPISENMHLKSLLCSRYVSFYTSLQKSMKLSIRFLANISVNNVQTVLGNNMFNIAHECNVDICDLSSNIVKKNMHFSRITEDSLWKVDFIKELMDLKAENLFIPGFDNTDIQDIFRFICCD